jgi:hypothetical protein
VYRGCNSASSLDSITWKQWLTEPANLVEQKGNLTFRVLAWYDLSKGPYKARFTSNGQYSRWNLDFSVTGFDTPSFKITLDGKELKFNYDLSLDNVLYTVNSKIPLPKGEHEIIVWQTQLPASGKPIHQLAAIKLNEYAAEPLFHEDNSYIGAYPTFDIDGLKTFRPTNEGCLMRKLSVNSFCPVCKQGMWDNLMKRISLIDSATVDCARKSIKLNVLAIGQFRKQALGLKEKLTVDWFFEGKLSNLNSFEIKPEKKGKWQAVVKYTTEERRADPIESKMDVDYSCV